MKIPLHHLAFLVLFLGFLSTGMIHAVPVEEGIAAIVNGEVITRLEVDRAAYAQEADDYKKYQDDVIQLQQQLKSLRLKTVQDLIDRKLIIAAFRQSGGSIPASYMEQQVQRAIKDQYQGDEDRFMQALAAQGESLDEYKARIEDNAIVKYMTKTNVDDKVTSKVPEEAETEREALRNAWLVSLRKDAWIEIRL
jgi:hypothetical protein